MKLKTVRRNQKQRGQNLSRLSFGLYEGGMRMSGQNRKKTHISRMTFRNRLILLVLFIGSAAAFLLTIVFGILYHRSMLRDYRSEIKSRLEDTDTVFNSYVDNTAALTISLYNAPEGTIARVAPDFEFASHHSFLNYLQNLMMNSGYIHSIYFLDQEGQVSMWVKGNGSYTKELDDVLPVLLAGKTQSPFVWSAPYRYSDTGVPMLTFFFSEVPLGMEYYTGTVVVNVELNELCRRIFDGDNQSTEMIILNGEGIVTLHSDPSHIGEDWSEEAFVQKVLQEGEDVFDMKVDGERYEFLCMPSAREGFYLIAKSDYTAWSAFAEVFLIVPMICLVAIALMAILAVRMGTRLVQPLTRTVEEIRQSGMGERLEFDTLEDRDELRFLQKYASHVNQYVDEVLENDQKNRVIYNLIRNDRNVDIQPFLLERKILSPNTGYCVITAEFVCRYEVTDIEELNSIRHSMSKQFEQILSGFGYCTCYEHGLRYLLLLLAEEEGAPVSVEEIRDEMNEGCDILMRENSGTDIYVVISRRLENGSISAKPVVQRNNKRMEALQIYGINGAEVIKENPIQERPSDRTVDSCIQALKKNDREAYLNAVIQMIDETKEVSHSQFISWLVQVTEQIGEIKAAMHRNYVKQDRNRLYTQAQQIQDREGILEWFQTIYDDVNEKMDQIRRTTTASLIEEAVDYILQNFWDDQLGAATLAQRLHISAQYFGQLFMEFAGKSVSEYIIQVRMEKARNYLLARPDLEIMEVAAKVGYHSASYFSTAFRKYYGVSPSKLRSSLHAQEQEKCNTERMKTER